MTIRPLQINPRTNEPFLRLPSPHESIIITPPRKSDAPLIVPLLNDPRIYTCITTLPNPYQLEDAETWQERVTGMADEILRALRESAPEQTPTLLDGCPVRAIREISADGSELYLGDIAVARCGWPDLADDNERRRLQEENESRAIGDPEIVWTIGDYLAPSHHGRGIMTEVVRTIIHEWIIPRMGGQRIEVVVKESNTASRRVFEKNGFMVKTSTVLEWKLE